MQQRHVQRRARVRGQAFLLAVSDDPNNFGKLPAANDPLADHFLSWPITTRRRFIDDGHERRVRRILRGEFTPLRERGAERSEIVRADGVGIYGLRSGAFYNQRADPRDVAERYDARKAHGLNARQSRDPLGEARNELPSARFVVPILSQIERRGHHLRWLKSRVNRLQGLQTLHA